MQIPKPSEDDKARFTALIPQQPSVQVKPMFGNLGAFVNGNMFAGLFGSAIGVRLIDDGTRAELAAIEGTGPFGPDGRPMGGYLALPDAWAAQPELAQQWIETALRQVETLPVKVKAPKKSAR
jgi:TfoX/Sxy family transcriptional regulator of competence genes